MAGKLERARQVLRVSKNFLSEVNRDMAEAKGIHKVGAAFLGACVLAHSLGGLSSLYFWAAAHSYEAAGHNPAAPGVTLLALSTGIEGAMGHSAANHYPRFRSVVKRLRARKDRYDAEARDHVALKPHQKVGHGLGRFVLYVGFGAAGVVGRTIAGNPGASEKHLKGHAYRAALVIGVGNGGVGLACGFAMKAAESSHPEAAQKALEIAQGPIPTAVFVTLAITSMVLSRRSVHGGNHTTDIPGQREATTSEQGNDGAEQV